MYSTTQSDSCWSFRQKIGITVRLWNGVFPLYYVMGVSNTSDEAFMQATHKNGEPITFTWCGGTVCFTTFPDKKSDERSINDMLQAAMKQQAQWKCTMVDRAIRDLGPCMAKALLRKSGVIHGGPKDQRAWKGNGPNPMIKTIQYANDTLAGTAKAFIRYENGFASRHLLFESLLEGLFDKTSGIVIKEARVQSRTPHM